MATFIPDISLGENSRIVIGGVELLCQDGTVRENPAKIGTGCNLTGGFTTKTRGLYNLEWESNAQWSYAGGLNDNPENINPLSGPLALQPGTQTISQPVLIYPDILNQPSNYYNMPISWITVGTCKTASGETGGVISYSLSGENQGEYGTPNYPLGNIGGSEE